MSAGRQEVRESGGATARLRLPPTVLFGPGCAERVPAVLAETGARAPLVVTDPGVAATGLPGRVVEGLRAAGLAAELWDGGRPEPDDALPELCAGAAAGRDVLVAVGGGSVIDTAKVAALLAAHGGRTRDLYGFDRAAGPGLPVVAVPTTAGGGSEVSSHAVVLDREAGKKEVVAGDAVTPRAAVVDPDALRTVPAPVLLHAALDGAVHAVEAFVARRATPFTDGFVREALPRLVRALPRLLADRKDGGARAELSLGALFSGFAMAGAGAGAEGALR
jgi:alcohol dehydrogenase class IV